MKGPCCEDFLSFIVGVLKPSCGRTNLRVFSIPLPELLPQCLRVLQHVLTDGHTSVRAILSRKDAAVRSVANVSGAGPENQSLRLLAKDLLHAIHNGAAAASPQVVAAGCSAAQQEGRSYSGLGASAATTGKYQGFGNAPLGPKTLTEQVTDGIARVVDKIAGRPADKGGSDLLTEGLPTFQPVTVRSPPTASEGRTASLPPQPVRTYVKPQKARKKGRAGGGWDDDDDDDVDADDGNASGTISDTASLGDSAKISDVSGEPVNRLYEREVLTVEAFVDPSLEFPPSRRELDEACEKCASINADGVTQLLSAKIFAPQESVKMRALVLIEALLRKGHIDPASQGAPLLAQLKDLQDKSSDPVQVKARKISLIIQKLIQQPEV
ncbi:hypothetical protein V5799_010737 [Amblyomma americanum]|uniref:AP-4 complex accessory subunit Tepsin VHS/ENTH-like domain-containing protein n=1 Tax=Amblyomma americanum TaxID=6943 RepID=A0AAQ4EJC7_AMBAM